ncbi:DUF3237 domain-containing protein [Pseudomonas sp. 2FG]|uniref:DUF3237 domain-containing protein n=1 Tax=Pseudomonas sp. 2FG TaxID=2502191 RepID=UPI0010F5DCB3|nr:DUF3237 domain-containing protein [Pseudomonas sp. 2FG]
MRKSGLCLAGGLLLSLALPASAIDLNENFALNVTLTALSDYRTGGKFGPEEGMGKSADGHRINYPIVGGTFTGRALSFLVGRTCR